MKTDNNADSPKFPILAITRTRGIHTKNSVVDLTPRSLEGATQGYYDGIVILDSDYNKWKMDVWRRDAFESSKPSMLSRLIHKKRWVFKLTWEANGTFDVEELKSLILYHFDSKNDFYSEMGVDLKKI